MGWGLLADGETKSQRRKWPWSKTQGRPRARFRDSQTRALPRAWDSRGRVCPPLNHWFIPSTSRGRHSFSDLLTAAVGRMLSPLSRGRHGFLRPHSQRCPVPTPQQSGKRKRQVVQTGAWKCDAQGAWPVGVAWPSPRFSLT